MKKLFILSLALCATILTASAQQAAAAAPKELIANGNFAELTKQKIGGQEIMFPKRWELYGNTGGVVITKTATGNEVTTKGAFTIGMGVPKNLTDGTTYEVKIRAKGQGKIGIRTWSWEGYSPRTNHRHENKIPKFDLTEQYQDFTFKVPYLPKEHYMVIYIDGANKTIENVSCTVAK